MKAPNLLDISNYAFKANIVLSNIQHIPFIGAVLSPFLAIPVALIYLVGYSTWYLGSLFENKVHPHKVDAWYAFAEFKLQNEIAALLGVVATILLLTLPTFTIPIAWIIFSSNLFWVFATHHENSVPHHPHENFSTAVQTAYTCVTLAITALSFFTALWTTLACLLPVAVPFITPLFSALCLVLTVFIIGSAINHYLKSREWENQLKTRVLHQCDSILEPEHQKNKPAMGLSTLLTSTPKIKPSDSSPDAPVIHGSLWHPPLSCPEQQDAPASHQSPSFDYRSCQIV